MQGGFEPRPPHFQVSLADTKIITEIVVANVAKEAQQGLIKFVHGDGVDPVESAKCDKGNAFEGRGEPVLGHACSREVERVKSCSLQVASVIQV